MTCTHRPMAALDWSDGDDGALVALDIDTGLMALAHPDGRWAIEGPRDTLASGDAADAAEAQAMAAIAMGRALAGAKADAYEAPVVLHVEDAPLPDSRPAARAVSVRAADAETTARLEAAWADAMALGAAGDRMGAMMLLIDAGMWRVEDYRLVRCWERVRGGHLLATRQVHQARTLRIDHGDGWTISIPLVIWTWTHDGKQLPDGWQLVHIDGDRGNCRPSNLVAEPLSLSRWTGPARAAGQGVLLTVPQDLDRVRAIQAREAQAPDALPDVDDSAQLALGLSEPVEAPRCRESQADETGTMEGHHEEPTMPCPAPSRPAPETVTARVSRLLAEHSVTVAELARLLAVDPTTLDVVMRDGWLDLMVEHGAEWADPLLDGGLRRRELAALHDILDDCDDEDLGGVTPRLVGQALHEVAMRRLTAWVATDRRLVRDGRPSETELGERALALASEAGRLMEVGCE